MNALKYLAGAAVLMGTASVALADFDVSPTVSGGTILTNAISDATGQFVQNVRVFKFAFDDPSTPFFTQDPGFHTPIPSGFAANVGVTVSPVGGLEYWSGTGSPSFGAPGTGDSLRLAFGTTSAIASGSGPSGSVFIGNTDSAGDLHEHIESTLLAPTGQTPADGIYLVPLQLTSPSYQTSQTFYALYNNGGLDGSVIDSAVTFIRDTRAPGSNIAPEPASAALLILSAGGLLGRRRRT
jgi:hypothetical protein